jgi:hypothetical protein
MHITLQSNFSVKVLEAWQLQICQTIMMSIATDKNLLSKKDAFKHSMTLMVRSIVVSPLIISSFCIPIILVELISENKKYQTMIHDEKYKKCQEVPKMQGTF